jgi:hypothetical protein
MAGRGRERLPAPQQFRRRPTLCALFQLQLQGWRSSAFTRCSSQLHGRRSRVRFPNGSTRCTGGCDYSGITRLSPTELGRHRARGRARSRERAPDAEATWLPGRPHPGPIEPSQPVFAVAEGENEPARGQPVAIPRAGGEAGGMHREVPPQVLQPPAARTDLPPSPDAVCDPLGAREMRGDGPAARAGEAAREERTCLAGGGVLARWIAHPVPPM